MSQNKEIPPPQYDLNAKWDACLDLGVRRFFYSSATGAFAGLLFFRSPVTRWASVAFGAGLGIGSAYSDCSQKFAGSSQTSPGVAKLTEPFKPLIRNVDTRFIRFNCTKWKVPGRY
ncbi:putative MICOS complex subunit Mic10 protein [Helianthus annuus]|nr:putative MICOS complex subunit Mic10 protein [Helianthus annuus]